MSPKVFICYYFVSNNKDETIMEETIKTTIFVAHVFPLFPIKYGQKQHLLTKTDCFIIKLALK